MVGIGGEVVPAKGDAGGLGIWRKRLLSPGLVDKSAHLKLCGLRTDKRLSVQWFLEGIKLLHGWDIP